MLVYVHFCVADCTVLLRLWWRSMTYVNSATVSFGRRNLWQQTVQFVELQL